MTTLGQVVYLILGGISGTLLRHFLSAGIYRIFPSRFPFGTLAVNLTGCFILGLLVSLGEGKIHFNVESRLFLITGFCGAFTTFSTLTLETVLLWDEGLWFGSLFNMLGSAAIGLFVFKLGMMAGDWV